MANFLNTKIALRTDTIQKWNSLSNQVLLNGEVAIVMTDEKLPLFKIGDGIHKFYELPYSNSRISSDMVNATDIIAKSICQGANSSAVPQSLAAGLMVSSDVPYSQAFGYNTKTKSGDVYSFTWSGETSRDINKPYSSHAIGSFNINPNNGLSGFYIGDRNFKDIIESEISGFSKVTLISNDVAYSKDLSVINLSYNEYQDLVNSNATSPSILYIVSSDYVETYGQQIKNVAPATDLSDAVNLEQLTEVSSIVNDKFADYSLTSHTHSNYALSSIKVAGQALTADVTAATISNAIGLNDYSKVTLVSNDVAYSKDLSVVKITGEEYYKLVDDEKTNPSALYIVDDLNLNAYYQTIKNVASPELSDDAATKNYVDNAVKNNVQVSAVLDSGTQIASISVNGVATSLYAPASGGGIYRYPLITAALSTINGSLCCLIQDHAVTTIEVSSATTPLVITLPPKPSDNGARDFILRIEVSSSTAPGVTFVGLDESITFDSDSDDWMTIEPGLNLISFTETR